MPEESWVDYYLRRARETFTPRIPQIRPQITPSPQPDKPWYQDARDMWKSSGLQDVVSDPMGFAKQAVTNTGKEFLNRTMKPLSVPADIAARSLGGFIDDPTKTPIGAVASAVKETDWDKPVEELSPGIGTELRKRNILGHGDPISNFAAEQGLNILGDPLDALPVGPVLEGAQHAVTPFWKVMKEKGFKQLAHGMEEGLDVGQKMVQEGFNPSLTQSKTDIIGHGVHAAGVSEEDYAKAVANRRIPSSSISRGYGDTQIPMTMKPDAPIIDTTKPMPWEDVDAIINTLDPVRDADAIKEIKREFKVQARPIPEPPKNLDPYQRIDWIAAASRAKQAEVEHFENLLLHKQVFGRGNVSDYSGRWAPLNNPAMGDLTVSGQKDPVAGIWHRDLVGSKKPNMAGRPEGFLVKDPVGYSENTPWQPFKTKKGKTWPEDAPKRTVETPLGEEGKGGVMLTYPQVAAPAQTGMAARVKAKIQDQTWKNLPAEENKIGGSTRPATGKNADVVEGIKGVLSKYGLNPKYYLYSPSLMEKHPDDIYKTVVTYLKAEGGKSQLPTGASKAAQEIETLQQSYKGGAQVMSPSKGKIGKPVPAGTQQIEGAYTPYASEVKKFLVSQGLSEGHIYKLDPEKIKTPEGLHEEMTKYLYGYEPDVAEQFEKGMLPTKQAGTGISTKIYAAEVKALANAHQVKLPNALTSAEHSDPATYHQMLTSYLKLTKPKGSEPLLASIEDLWGKKQAYHNKGKVAAPSSAPGSDYPIETHMNDIAGILETHGIDPKKVFANVNQSNPHELHDSVIWLLDGSSDPKAKAASKEVSDLWAMKAKDGRTDVKEPEFGMGVGYDPTRPIPAPGEWGSTYPPPNMGQMVSSAHEKELIKILKDYDIAPELINVMKNNGAQTDQGLTDALVESLHKFGDSDSIDAANTITNHWETKQAKATKPKTMGQKLAEAAKGSSKPNAYHLKDIKKIFTQHGLDPDILDSVDSSKLTPEQLHQQVADYLKAGPYNDQLAGVSVDELWKKKKEMQGLVSAPKSSIPTTYHVFNMGSNEPAKVFNTRQEALDYIGSHSDATNLGFFKETKSASGAAPSYVQESLPPTPPYNQPKPPKVQPGFYDKYDVYDGSKTGGKTVKTFDSEKEAQDFIHDHPNKQFYLASHDPKFPLRKDPTLPVDPVAPPEISDAEFFKKWGFDKPLAYSSDKPKPKFDVYETGSTKTVKSFATEEEAKDYVAKHPNLALDWSDHWDDQPTIHRTEVKPHSTFPGDVASPQHGFGPALEEFATPKTPKSGTTYNVADKGGKTIKTFLSKDAAEHWVSQQSNARHLTVHGQEVSGWAGGSSTPDPNFKHPPAPSQMKSTPGTFTKKNVDTSHAAGWGGSHEKQVYTKGGQDYLFKPSYGWKHAPDQELTANNVAKLGGLHAPEMTVEEIDGVRGSMQSLYGNKGDWPSLRSKGQSIEKLSTGELMDIIRNQPVDWLTANHDAHQGQWLVTPTGILEIDRGQAFKHWGEDSLSKSYNPNAKYGEDPSIYIAIHKLWAAGKLPQLNEKDIAEATSATTTNLHKKWTEVMAHLSEGLQRAGKSDQIPEAAERFSRLQTSMNKFWTK